MIIKFIFLTTSIQFGGLRTLQSFRLEEEDGEDDERDSQDEGDWERESDASGVRSGG